MRKMLSVLMGVVLIAGLSGVAFADLTSLAQTRVAVNVVPNIHVSVQAPTVTPQIQRGIFSIDVVFTVHANSQKISLAAAASRLYKGDDPTSIYSIPLYNGVTIVPTNANTINAVSNVAQYEPGNTPIGVYPGQTTNAIAFESGQNNAFSQDVRLTFSWNQVDDELPTGQYSGMVKMLGAVLPSTFGL